MDYRPTDLLMDLSRAERVFDISISALRQAVERGEVRLDDNGRMAMTEAERWAESRGGMPSPKHCRALSVLPRLKTVYTTGEVAEVLGCSTDYVIRRIDSGAIKGYRLPNMRDDDSGGPRRVTRLSLAAYLSEHPCAQADAMGLEPVKAKPAASSRKVKS